MCANISIHFWLRFFLPNFFWLTGYILELLPHLARFLTTASLVFEFTCHLTAKVNIKCGPWLNSHLILKLWTSHLPLQLSIYPFQDVALFKFTGFCCEDVTAGGQNIDIDNVYMSQEVLCMLVQVVPVSCYLL